MYKLDITGGAKRDIAKLEQRISDFDFQRLLDAIEKLALDPRPLGTRKLKGKENSYRLRVGKYRIVYEIWEKILTITVIEVARRNENTYNW
jgi:mRNA interferase RelE/StbE